jgi:tetratricopeptide (TPR) repeat protein
MATEFQERNPYVGPRPFERWDRDLFFGRDREANEVLSLVIAHRALLLYAQSGAGKTSLLNAKLIPLLEKEGFEILPVARVRGLIPEDIQPKDIPNLYVFNTLMSWTEKEADPRRLAQMSLADFLKEREHLTDEEGLPSARVVIFDQFEELFAFYQEHWEDREKFFEQVRDALEGDPLLRVVFVVREDYIAQLDPYASLLPEKLRTRFRLERLRERAALSAVTGPLAKAKPERSFAEGVAEQLVEELLKIRVATGAGETVEVTGEFVEPVQLQVVCQSLWGHLSPDVTVITQAQLKASGDVNQALSGFYEECIGAAQESGVEEGDLRAWFEDHLITPVGTRGTVYSGEKETGGIPNAAVVVLENLHLIRGEERAGARWYELTHDRFIEPIQESNKTWRESPYQLAAQAATYLDQGRWNELKQIYRDALGILRELGKRRGEEATLLHRSHWLEGSWNELVEYNELAFEVSKLLQDWRQAGIHAYAIGFTYFQQGNIVEADRWGREAMSAMAQVADEYHLARVKRLPAMVARERGDYQTSKQLLDEMLASGTKLLETAESDEEIRNIKDNILADALTTLANLERKRGNYSEARRLYKESLKINGELGNTEQIGLNLNHLGRVDLAEYEQARRSGQDDEAACHLSLAEEHFTKGRQASEEALRTDQILVGMWGQGRVAEERGEYARAWELAQEALDRYGDSEAAEVAEVQELLGEVESLVPSNVRSAD